MNVNHEVMEKVAEVLKNQKVVDKMNQASTQEELYSIACEHMEGVSQEDFIQALKDLQEAGDRIELTESELDSVAGGTAASKEGKYTIDVHIQTAMLN